MIAGTCKYCGCTEEAACSVGCAWTDATETQCTACLEGEAFAEMVVRVMATAATNARPPITLVSPAWSGLGFEQKQLLVMTARAVTEQMTRHLASELLSDARDDLIEFNEIVGFLAEADAVQEHETISVAVRRLLEPHIGRRIVLPAHT